MSLHPSGKIAMFSILLIFDKMRRISVSPLNSRVENFYTTNNNFKKWSFTKKFNNFELSAFDNFVNIILQLIVTSEVLTERSRNDGHHGIGEDKKPCTLECSVCVYTIAH